MPAPLLVSLAGLPGTGKSTLARAVAARIGAVWLRIDSIEQAIRTSGVVPGTLDDAGYRAAWAVAEDNLLLGRTVIADCVNPWPLSRDAWRDAGLRTGARVLEIEVICSDADEHRRRVENRRSDVPGLIPPDWAAVKARDYRPWNRHRAVIDTAGRSAEACVAEIAALLIP